LNGLIVTGNDYHLAGFGC